MQLPASFFAFRKQQHRWTCGPVQLWYRAAADIARSAMPLPRKAELLLMYFGVRKAATHFVAMGFFCTLVPLAAFTPEVRIPTWVLVHLPVVVTVTTAAFTPRGWVYAIPYVLFENAMGLVKLGAVVTGEGAAGEAGRRGGGARRRSAAALGGSRAPDPAPAPFAARRAARPAARPGVGGHHQARLLGQAPRHRPRAGHLVQGVRG